MSKLQGKVAVVTGGSRDIGRAISIKLAKEGAKVVINYFNSEEEGNETVRLIKENGGEAIAAYADVTNQDDINNLVAQTKTAFGEKIDILVNNSGGLFAHKSIEEVDISFYELVMNVNFKSVVFVTQAFKPLINSGGTVINLSSQAARDGGGGGSSLYAASKGTVAPYSRALAKEFGHRVFELTRSALG